MVLKPNLAQNKEKSYYMNTTNEIKYHSQNNKKPNYNFPVATQIRVVQYIFLSR